MRNMFPLPVGLAAVLLLFCAPTTNAHTWAEQLTVIAPNGTFVGAPGYSRGFVPRAAVADPNAAMVYLLPPNGRSTGNAILPTDLMCKSTQLVGNQTAGFPALRASPGDQVAIQYAENGHVTQPDLPAGKPAGSGAVYVYGTSKSLSSDTYLNIHHVWNTEGTGGDGRGVLLATRNFDDGQCYQYNTNSSISLARAAEFPHAETALSGPDILCQTDVPLPTNISTDTYTLYWVWEWPTLDSSGQVLVNESYTACADVKITPSRGSKKIESINFAKGQDLNYAAIQAQMETAFLIKPNFTVAPAASAAPIPVQSSPISSNAGGGFITVTVTATPAKETVYVTVTAGGSRPSTTLSKSTVTVSPLPATTQQPSRTTAAPKATPTSARSSPATSVAPSSPPPVVPFLAPDSSVVQVTTSAAPSTPSTKSSPSKTATPSTNSTPSIPSTTSKPSSISTPSATPTSSTTSTPSTISTPSTTPTSSTTSTLLSAPSQTSHSNGTLHNRTYKLRGRLVRV